LFKKTLRKWFKYLSHYKLMNKFYSNFNDQLTNNNFDLFITTVSACTRAKIISNVLSKYMWYENDKLYKVGFYKTTICEKDIGDFIVTISRKLIDNSNKHYKRPQTDDIKKYLKRDEYYDLIQDILLLLSIDKDDDEEEEDIIEEDDEDDEISKIIPKTKKNKCKFEPDDEYGDNYEPEDEEEEEDEDEEEEDNIEIIQSKNGKKEVICSLHDVAKTIARFKKL
jgi:hypothetical protein